jgi:hypothetical protein
MRNELAAIAFVLLLSGSAFEVDAVTITKFANRNPAGACTPSIPAADTGVRPKASGFRNEGTASNFVICSLDIDTDAGGFSSLLMYFVSIDGATHSFDCTAMDRPAAGVAGDYSTKPVFVPATGTYFLSFSPSDFPDTKLVGWNASVTCNLPPGASIISVGGHHADNVGS